MGTRHSEQATSAPPVVEINDSDSESDRAAPLTTRPKLRTSIAAPDASSDTVDGDDDDTKSSQTGRKQAPRASKKRPRPLDDDSDDEGSDGKGNDGDDAYEPQSEAQMQAEAEADDAEDDASSSASEADEGGRRRSGRTRKAPVAFGGLDEDYDDPRLEYIAKPRRERQRGTRKAPSSKSSRKTASSSKSKRKAKAASSGSESEDSDDEFLMSETEASASKGGSQNAADDDKSFVVDKVIAREEHTLKEWTRICANKNTRFLTNMSIFLADDDDEEDGAKPKAQETKTEAASDDATKDKEPAADSAAAAASTPTPSSASAANGDGDVVMEDASAETSVGTANAECVTTPVKPSSAAGSGKSASTPISISEVSQTEERFLVKWKGLSYLHVSWETEKALLEVDKNAKGKIQRFRDKELMGLYSGTSSYGDEYFSPEFRIVDRILDIQDRPDDGFLPEDSDDEDETQLRFFYVKWKSLAYDELTWEREDDVNDDAAVAAYEDRLVRAAARHRRTAQSSSSASQKKHRKINFRGYSATNAPPFRDGNAFELRDYQLTGVNWMLFNWYQHRNSLLADEMGLGKTVQTVTFVNHLAVVEELPGPYLIIAPLSTLGHWQREFNTWTHLNAVVYHGSASARQHLQEYEFYLTEDEYDRADASLAKRSARAYKQSSSTASVVSRSKRDYYRFDVLITTPEMCATSDFSTLTRVQWQALVVDEAHRLKNKSSKLSSLIHKNFKYDSILLLTGTPLQNNVEELWTLLNFLDKDRFDSMEHFLERFGDLKDMTQVEQLHSELKPFLLRRMKEDVEKSLAPKEETIVEVELTVLQKQYYRAIYEMNTEFLARGRKKAQTPSLMNVAMELRKCCNHPFLIKGVEEQEIIRLQQQNKSSNALTEREMTTQIQEILVTSSGKLVLLDKLLPRLQANGHRVLLFSQFKIMLDILQDYLRLRAYNCERIDGNITGNDRQAAIDRFCAADSAAFVMLLSTRAGGVGINLTAADTVIIYDSDWNPQNDLQAQARCHRIGQKKSVKIYRLLTSKTYELHMFHQASLKLGLDQAVLGGIRSKDTAGGFLTTAPASKSRVNGPSKDEIEHLLKHGAYEIFKEEKDGEAEAASKRFSEESIDQILDRSTKIVHDPKANADDGKKSLMSSFSKATFVSSTNPDEQVALDDPDFWTKVIGLQEVVDKPVEPSPLKKRRRRPVKSYLIDESDNEATNARAARQKGKKAAPVPDNDEFVISSSSEDDDDSDDDDLADDDFARRLGAKQRSKHQKHETPPVSMYTERIGDLLATFGYGRWDEMLTSCHYLKTYALADLKMYTQQYIVHLVHIASGTAVVNTTPMSNGEMPEPLSSTKKLAMIDSFSDRFDFTAFVLRDLGSPRMSLVQLPKNLRIKPTSIKAQREASTRLQQIERMFLVQKIIRSKVGAPSPMVSLLNDLQLLTREQVREVLSTGTLPDAAVFATLRAARSDAAKSAAAAEQDAQVETLETAPAAAPDAAMQSEAEAPAADASASATTAADADTSAPTASPADAPVATPSADTATSAPEGEANDAAPGAAPDTTASESAPAAAATDAQPSPSTDADGVAQPTPSDEAAHAPNATEMAASSPPAASAPSPDDELKARVERKDALGRLRALPDVGGAEAVAPWWISVVDDVILLLYVFKDGWFKGRTLPRQLVEQSSLFGDRASHHDALVWPTVATLTRRVRSIVTAWTNARKLRQQSQAVASQPLQLQFPQAAPAATPVYQVSGYYGANHAAGIANGLHPAHMSSALPVTPFSSSRHNRFAKITFAFGIPDTRTCRDDTERLEKWRYFLQDELLSIADQPMTELLYEALDLERCCRLRTQYPSATPAELAAQAAAPGNSILGGKRGYWLLTTTQCRRLLQRVDLFRLLRTQILVLPPNQLLDIVDRVVTAFRATDSSKNEFPRWWNSPRHDILLLQGVECYGLDEYLSHVWKLQLFADANPTGSFPNTTWVENYVAALALRCRRAINASSSQSSTARRAAATERKRKATSQPKRESTEVRQRIRDIQGMRDEDPYFTPAVRMRQLSESNDAAMAATKSVEVEAAADAPPTPADARDTNAVAGVDDANDEVAEVALAPEQQQDDAPAPEPERVASAPAPPAAPSPPAPTAPATETFASPRSRQQSIQQAMKQQEQQRPRARSRVPSARTGGPTLRTRAPRSWDVIVIDESSDDE